MKEPVKNNPEYAKKPPLRRMLPCLNTECRLRKLGCTGFAGCPGYKTA
ncbi:MAG: hypothetical protein M0Z59_02255 [Nitrospiraceae bacterium]|nr:hypothetical protein [Nitrospiraceae bacterium]